MACRGTEQGVQGRVGVRTKEGRHAPSLCSLPPCTQPDCHPRFTPNHQTGWGRPAARPSARIIWARTPCCSPPAPPAQGDATYLIVTGDNTIEKFGVNAVCTHLGCVVPWNQAENKFMCPCHGSQYDPQVRPPRMLLWPACALVCVCAVRGRA